MHEINNDFYHDLGEGWYTRRDHPIALLRAENRLRIPWMMHEIQKHWTGPVSVVDFGCGAGMLTNALSQKGHRVSGIDLSEESLWIAKQKDTTQSVDYRCANVYRTPFADASFDVVSAFDILEHVQEPNKLVEEAARVLKPGGLFFFHTFNRNFLSFLLIIKGVEWFVRNTPPNMHVYSLFLRPEELNCLCRNHALRVFQVLGMRPRFLSRSFASLLCTKTVSEHFSFRFCNSLATGYCGTARKENVRTNPE